MYRITLQVEQIPGHHGCHANHSSVYGRNYKACF